MSTTAIKRLSTQCKSESPTTPPVQQSLTALDHFERTTDYQFFGTIVGERRYIDPKRIGDVAQWIAAHCHDVPTENQLAALVKACAECSPGWFLWATAVRLAKQSRGLMPGIHAFTVTRNFTRISDPNAPTSAVDAYTRAIFEEPKRTFVYLEPLWRNEDGKQTPTTTEDLKTLLARQQSLLLQLIPKIHRAERVKKIMAPCVICTSLFFDTIAYTIAIPFLLVFGMIRLIMQPIQYISSNIYDLAEMKERRALQGVGFRAGKRLETMSFLHAVCVLVTVVDITALANLVYEDDPIIAFEVPELKSMFNNEMPLALVVHWD